MRGESEGLTMFSVFSNLFNKCINLGLFRLQRVYCVDRQRLYLELIKPNGDCLKEWPEIDQTPLFKDEPRPSKEYLDFIKSKEYKKLFLKAFLKD